MGHEQSSPNESSRLVEKKLEDKKEEKKSKLKEYTQKFLIQRKKFPNSDGYRTYKG